MFELIFEQSGPTGNILRGISMLTIFLIIVIAILMFQLIVTAQRQMQLKRMNQELSQMRSPVYADIIRQSSDRIDTLNYNITDKEETISQLKSKIDRLTFALYHDCLAWPKINALQNADTTKSGADNDSMTAKSSKSKSVKSSCLDANERNSLLRFIRLCRDDIPVPHDMLTDDELILYHLLTSGIDNASIAALSGVTDGTLRQRKFRLSRKISLQPSD